MKCLIMLKNCLIYFEKYGTEILYQNNDNIHIYNNEEKFPINKDELN